MSKKEENDRNYRKLMELRKRDPKSYGLSMIGVAYEDVRNYSKSKGCVSEELAFLVSRLKDRIGQVMVKYSVTPEDIRDYCSRNQYALSMEGTL